MICHNYVKVSYKGNNSVNPSLKDYQFAINRKLVVFGITEINDNTTQRNSA